MFPRSKHIATGSALALAVSVPLIVGPAAGSAAAETPCPGRVESPHFMNPSGGSILAANASVRCTGGEAVAIEACIQWYFNKGWRSIGPTACDEDEASNGEEAYVSMLMDAACGTNRYRTLLEGIRSPKGGAPQTGSQISPEVEITRTKDC